MPTYVPHYSDKTACKHGELASPADVVAKQQLRREAGLICINDVWVPNEGIQPLLKTDHELTADEQELMCVRPFSPSPTQVVFPE